MSAKSAIKQLLPGEQQGRLFKWVALLTGSKNALKGVGFFLGGALLALLGFKGAVLAMAAALALVWTASVFVLKQDLGKAKNKPKFSELFSKSRAINILSAARLFLFGARDVWFVVALPVFLSSQLQWNFWQTGGFLASWIIGYGIVQSAAPFLLRTKTGTTPTGHSAFIWALLLTLVTAGLAWLFGNALSTSASFSVTAVLIAGLIVFGIVFAINSSVHSYLIVRYANSDGVSLDVGFYYMANALGRLLGTILSGWVYQAAGLVACLWVAAVFIGITTLISIALPRNTQ